jgi:hypothetical protein
VGVLVSDWRNPGDYGYTERLTLHDWAWEFLRRSSEYRSDWQTLEDAKPSLSSEEYLEAAKTIGSGYGLGMAIDPNLKPPESDHFWMIGCSLRVLWGMPDGTESGLPWPGYPTAAFLVFNLTVPIEPQLQEASRVLNRYQRELVESLGYPEPITPSVRPQTDKYCGYIRALDGREAGVSQKKIGEHLFPESPEPRDVARRALAKADKLSQGGYRELLYKPNL